MLFGSLKIANNILEIIKTETENKNEIFLWYWMQKGVVDAHSSRGD